MEKVKELKVEQSLADYLQALDFDCAAHRDLIVFMLEQNKDTSTEAFRKYSNEYQELNCQFAVAKDQITKKIIPPEYSTESYQWQLDYATATVSIYKR